MVVEETATTTTAAPTTTTEPLPAIQSRSLQIPQNLNSCSYSSRRRRSGFSIEELFSVGLDDIEKKKVKDKIKNKKNKKEKKKEKQVLVSIPTMVSNWPWLVNIGFQASSNAAEGVPTVDKRCSGTIIADNWILTQGYCCDGMQTAYINFGQTNRSSGTAFAAEGRFQMISSELTIHHDYDSSNGNTNNLCMIRTTENIFDAGSAVGCTKDNNCINSACVPNIDVTHGDACWVAGFGGDGETVIENGVNILDSGYCSARLDTAYTYAPDGLCAGLPDEDGNGLLDAESNNCAADAGSPLMCEAGNYAVLRGIAISTSTCDLEGIPNVYQNVHLHKEWIDRVKLQAAQNFAPVSNSIAPGLRTCGNNAASQRPAFINPGEERREVTEDNRIVNGVEVAVGSWPYIVALHFQTQAQYGTSMASLCSGTILSDNYILTAAHCCLDKVNTYVAIGEHDRANHSDQVYMTVFGAQNFIIHPNYSSDSKNFDACLIKTNQSIFETAARQGCGDGCVNAVCLPTEAPQYGDACWVAGWGMTSSGGPLAAKLQSAGVNLMSEEYCLAHSTEGFSIESDEMCAGIPDMNANGFTDGGVDSCQGDSGGPLVCKNMYGDAVLTGIVSWGNGCAAEGSPGVYGNVFSYMDWINATMNN